MIHTVDKKLHDNILARLAAKVMRNHFSKCATCPAGNKTKKLFPYSNYTTEFVLDKVL